MNKLENKIVIITDGAMENSLGIVKNIVPKLLF